MKKIMVLGPGGREHAIAAAVAKSDQVEKIYCIPGNAGTAMENKCENVSIIDFDAMADFAIENGVDFAIVGPEALLCAGVVDVFRKKGIKIFGPDERCARLEGSKAYSKDFMKKYGVKTAAYENFSSYDDAYKYLQKCSFPQVLKADGLAAGKGVLICSTKEDAEAGLKELMVDKAFGDAGNEIVIEQFLEGKEASILSLYDGKTIIPFLSAKDHKKIGEGETGLNTGGMGVVAPNPWVTDEVMQSYLDDIQETTLNGLKAEGLDFCGIIFFGLMITNDGVYCLEYNIRFGDPEAETVLPMMESDIVPLFEAAMEGNAANVPIKWKEGHSCCVVMASGGYPGAYKKGVEICNLDKVENKVYIAGAKFEGDKVVTDGGRILCVTATADTLEKAREKAYSDIGKISIDKAVFRTDIGL